jgi:alcohol dehydrogenase
MNSEFGIQRAPGLVLFGAGQRRALAKVALQFGKRVLICTDERIAVESFLTEIASDIQANGGILEIFSAVQPEVPVELVEESVAFANSFRPDVIVAIGGGSCIDHAKCLNILFSHGQALREYYGENNVPGPVLPLIAMPTTAGTGSEVTPVAVVSDTSATLKVGISSAFIIPACAICDPELTLTCPSELTAHAGADALTHAIEAFCATRRQPDPEIGISRVFVGKNCISDVNALSAIRLISGSLSNAVQNPDDISARADVMLGALLAGLAFGAAGTAAAHALQYPIGAITGTSHGLGVATLMPFVMDFNRSSIEAELAEIGEAMRTYPQATADDAIESVRRLFAEIGIPDSLRKIGFPQERIEWAATQALTAGRLIDNNPRPLDVDGLREILRAASK